MWPVVVFYFIQYYGLIAVGGLLLLNKNWRGVGKLLIALNCFAWIGIYAPGLVADQKWSAQKPLAGLHVAATASLPKSFLVRPLSASLSDIARSPSKAPDPTKVAQRPSDASNYVYLDFRWLAKQVDFIEIQSGQKFFRAHASFSAEECARTVGASIGLWGNHSGTEPYKSATSWRMLEPSGLKTITLPCLIGEEIELPTSTYVIEQDPGVAALSTARANWEGTRVLRWLSDRSAYEVLAWGGCLERVRVKFPPQIRASFEHPLSLADSTLHGPSPEQVIAAAFPALKADVPVREENSGPFGCARYILSG